MQRTVPDVSGLFQPLEDTIRLQLIPSLTGRQVSDLERRLLALSVRLGGMGLTNPVESADDEFKASSLLTSGLVAVVKNQDRDFSNLDAAEVSRKLKQVKSEKESKLKQKQLELKEEMGPDGKRTIELCEEKGAGAWLNALPIRSLGYDLNKQAFRDSICLRYNWRVPDTPAFCQCGVRNSVDHALTCKRGGFVVRRHNGVRDLEAQLMKEVCSDVKVEPELIPIGNEILNGNVAEKARLDVSGIGVWGGQERTFLDIRILHPNCESYKHKSMKQVYAIHKAEKKRSYNERSFRLSTSAFLQLL